MKLLELTFPLGSNSLGLAREHSDHSLDGLPLPGVDQSLMYAVLRHQLRDRCLAPDRLQRDLRLERRAVPFPLPSHSIRPSHLADQA